MQYPFYALSHIFAKNAENWETKLFNFKSNNDIF